jgi:uncharacterized membrane protein
VITKRITSLDFMRGIVMILMAIDHVRVYSGVPPGGDTPGVFFTRWVTHFCAPGFVFLAGTAAFFHGRKLGKIAALSQYLFTRGALLVILELTLIKFSWTFNADYSFRLAGVIWMLGWCMIIMAGLVRLSPRTIGWIGIGIVLLQQLFALPPRLVPAIAPLWGYLYPSGGEELGGMTVLYVIVPWIGVMAAGYGFGLIMAREPESRDRLLNRIGIGMTVAFLLIATAIATFGGGDAPFYIRLLNQQKYPASQLYLLMTLGPMIALLPLAEKARGTVANAINTIGRVPMFYYLAHIPVIHLSALIVNQLRTGSTHPEWYNPAPFAQVPEDMRWPLGLLYLVFAIDVAILYVACRWYARLKAERPGSWLRFI